MDSAQALRPVEGLPQSFFSSILANCRRKFGALQSYAFDKICSPSKDWDDTIAMFANKLIDASVRKGICGLIAVAFALGGISPQAEAGDVFARVESKGAVRCGVSDGQLGFSLKEPNGRWSGLDADFCRAVAAAALGNPEKVVFVPLITSARFLALRTGQIDLLAQIG